MSPKNLKRVVPSSYTRVIARELGLQERDLKRLLVGTDLPERIFLPGDETYMAVDQQITVLENAIAIVGGPEFGLRLGHSLEPSAHGPMGYLILSSPNVITALESFADFLPVRLPFSGVAITRDEAWLTCTLSLNITVSFDVKRLLQECFALMIQAVVESVLGTPLRDAKIGLMHAQPPYVKHYAEYIHARVSFDQPLNTVQIPVALLSKVNVNGHSESYAVARDLCLGLLDKVPMTRLSTVDKVRRLLLSSPMGSLTAVDVASALFITKRTLQRRLEREGVSYRDVLEQLLSELAAKHLCESNLTIESIALMLGYYDAAAFRKAFHRWYQLSPSEFRRGRLNP